MTSSMAEDQVAARAQSLQSVFGSSLWRGGSIAEEEMVTAVSAVLAYGESDEWLQPTCFTWPILALGGA